MSDEGAKEGCDTAYLLVTKMQIVMKCQSGYICHRGLTDLGSFVALRRRYRKEPLGMFTIKCFHLSRWSSFPRC